MKLGAIFPTPEIGNDPLAVRDWAQAAEDLGFDHIIAYDHVLGAVHEGRDPALMGPYTERDPFHEPFVLFGYLAGQTSRVELITGVLILTQRQTALVAKQAAEVDVLSSGRMLLGVGTGWNWVEYDALGVPYGDRGKRLDEQVDLLRQLWREPVVDFRGTYHRIDRAGILPQPTRCIPIWFGGFSEVALRRAARIGDGFLFGSTPKRMQTLHTSLRGHLEREGRKPAEFPCDAVVNFSQGPDEWREEFELWQGLGGTSLSLRAMDTAVEAVGHQRVGYEGLRSYIDALEQFRDTVR